jgi:hypothetical protein
LQQVLVTKPMTLPLHKNWYYFVFLFFFKFHSHPGFSMLKSRIVQLLLKEPNVLLFPTDYIFEIFCRRRFWFSPY